MARQVSRKPGRKPRGVRRAACVAPLSVYSLLLITAPPIGEPWYDFLHTRRNKFYDKRAIRSPDHRAWDQFTVPDGMKVGRLNGPLLHYSFRDLEHFAALSAHGRWLRDCKMYEIYLGRDGTAEIDL